MHMIAHDHPGIQQQAFLLLAEAQALDQDVLVVAAREDVDPADRTERDEV